MEKLKILYSSDSKYRYVANQSLKQELSKKTEMNQKVQRSLSEKQIQSLRKIQQNMYNQKINEKLRVLNI